VSEQASTQPHAANGFDIVAIRSADQLLPHIGAWDELALHAWEPNVFFESWFMLPAIRAFGSRHRLLFVFVYKHASKPGAETLAGFFPLYETHRYKGLPVRVLSLWHHPYSVFGAPLLRREFARECVGAFFDWACSGPHASSLIRLPITPGEGPFNQILVENCYTQRRAIFVNEAHARALFLPRADSAAYRAAALNNHHQGEMRRHERSLSRLGELEYRVLQQADDVPLWTNDFESLEASGWKGKQGTAFACNPPDQVFLRTILAEGFSRGQLLMLGLFLQGRPIALKCNLLAGDGSFAFKIAYDESLAKHSPGVLLELFNIDYLHRHREIRWMDSCAIPEHSMIDRLWLDRRVIHDVVVSTGRRPGDLVVAMLPTLRWLKGKLPFGRESHERRTQGSEKERMR
jgi:hypothetical protein